MSLPNIKFNISKNGLGLLQGAVEKTPGLLLHGFEVAGNDKVKLSKSYLIFSLKEAENLGILPIGDNSFAHRHIKDFYDEAGTGAKLWLKLFGQKMSSAIEFDARDLLQDAKGEIRVLGVACTPGISEGSIIDSLDADVHLAVVEAQKLGEEFSNRYNNLRCILSGNANYIDVSELRDYTTFNFNKVAMMLGSVEGQFGYGAVGLALGRMAKIPSQRKISRVKDGPATYSQCYLGAEKAEVLENAWDEIDSKGYIFLRSFPNRSGYYFSSDKTLTQVDDDFNSLARGLVMDEAVLIAYDTLIEELSDEIPVTTTGTIQPAIVKSWQNNIERQINGLMVDQGKLSGVKAFIDENQNILVTNNLTVSLQLLPVGYADFITVNIGFTTNLE